MTLNTRARVRAVRASIGTILRQPRSSRELTLLASVLSYYQVRAFARLMGWAAQDEIPTTRRENAEPGWTDIQGAALFLGRPKRWIYDNWPRLPFARKWGGKALAFNVEGMRRWDGTLRSDGRTD